MSPLLLLQLLVFVSGQDHTPSRLLGPRDFNPHPYEGQYLKEVSPPQPTKQGPVLFPNDAPPAPKTPLIVTARPLAEAIAKSDLNTTRPNEKHLDTQENQKQGFSNRADYSQSVLINAVTGKPIFDYDYRYEFKNPYERVLEKSRALNQGVDNRYDEYEEQTVLPPIYKALSDHAKNNVLRIQQAKKAKSYKVKEPDYDESFPNNHLERKQKNDEDDLSDTEQNSNYAFSYTVRDKQTGDDFSHSQKSSGSATNGEYRVRLPDGRMQIVSYTADENGYKANVRYDDVETTANLVDRNYNQQNSNHNIGTRINDYRPKISVATPKLQPIINYPHQRLAYPQIHEPVSRIREYGSRTNEYNPRIDYSAKIGDYSSSIHEQKPKISDNGPLAEYKARISDQNRQIAEYNQRIDQHNQRNGIQSQNEIRNEFNYDSYKGDLNYEGDSNYKGDTNYKVNDDYSYDSLKDYGEDYTDFEDKQFEYQPHEPKFNRLIEEQDKNIGVIVVPNAKSTVTPSLESLRNIFLNKIPVNSDIPVHLKVPSTTQNPNSYDSDENVVVIGTPKPNIYTKTSDVPTTQSTLYNNYQTPSSYLESTIASLRNRNIDYSGTKPVLSGSFIDRINKYLTF